MISPQGFSGTREDSEPPHVPLTFSCCGPLGESLALGLGQHRDFCVRWLQGQGVSWGARSPGINILKYIFTEREGDTVQFGSLSPACDKSGL